MTDWACDESVDNDESSFWLGFLFGWWGVLFSGATKGKSGINHALGGEYYAERFRHMHIFDYCRIYMSLGVEVVLGEMVKSGAIRKLGASRGVKYLR